MLRLNVANPALLADVLIMGLAAFWLASTVRRFPGVDRRIMAGKKPWACNACMSFWCVLPLAIAHAVWLSLFGDEHAVYFFAYLAASGVCLWLLERLEPPPQLPPPPPGATGG